MGWQSLSTVTVQGMQAIVTLLVAASASPQQFALLGIASILFNAQFLVGGSLGLGQALIYYDDRPHLRDAIDGAFVVTAALGFLIAAVAFVAAPAIASIFTEGFIRADVIRVVRVMSLIFLFVAIADVPQALIEKGLKFRRRAVPEMVAATVYAGLAIVLLREGAGVWAVIIARVAQSGVLTVCLYAAAPLRPRLVPRLDRAVLRTLFRYGKYLGAMAIVGFGVFNFDNAAIGWLVGAGPLGAYTLAYTVTNLVPTFLTQTLTKVFFPVYASIRGDVDALRQAHAAALHYLGVIMLPTTAALVAVVPSVLVEILGDEWVPAKLLVRILAIFGLARTLGAIASALLSAIGRPDLSLRSTIIALVIPLTLLWPLARFGATGVAVAFSAGQVAGAGYALMKGHSFWPRSARQLFAPATLATSLALLAVTAVPGGLSPPVVAVMQLVVFASAYVAVLMIVDQRVRAFAALLARHSGGVTAR